VKALALDSSTEILCLCGRNGSRFFEVTRDVDIHHARWIVPLVDLVLTNLDLSPGELELVAAARGPGSFTGLRIGLSTARGLAVGAGCPCVFIPTLDLYSAVPRGRGVVTAAVVDAKKKRFYAALYRNGERLTDYLDAGPDEIAALVSAYPEVVLTGPHGEILHPLLAGLGAADNIVRDPDARRGRGMTLLRMGMEALAAGRVDGPSTGPLYVRPPEARPGGGL